MGIMKSLKLFGFDARVLKDYKFLPKYLSDRRKWVRDGGAISKTRMILSDFSAGAGIASGHYFHQDLLVANYIFKAQPKRHIDVGSRIDGFVAHVAAFRPVEVLDVRPLQSVAHPNIIFRQADLMKDAGEGVTDSLSCLHAIEHFGLGRYGDPIDVNGHQRGIENLVRMVAAEGRLYISFPIGKRDQVLFNANRIFHPESILNYDVVRKHLVLERFDYVDDAGDLHLDVGVAFVVGKLKHGCGIYSFKKKS